MFSGPSRSYPESRKSLTGALFLALLLSPLVSPLVVPFFSCPAFAGGAGVVNVDSGAADSTRDRARHLLNRIAYGPRPGEIDMVVHKGTARYIAEQLEPASIKQPAALEQLVAKSPALTQTPGQLFMNYGKKPVMLAAGLNNKSDAGASKEARENIQKQIRQNYMTMYQQITDARLMRAVYSPRQLEEVLTEFWFNHFNVSFDKGLDHIWVGSYEEQAIRPHVLGKFRDLLSSTSHHAAMLFYLDNWQNTTDKPQSQNVQKKRQGRFSGINENYARELMELHTLGVDGGYSQADVIALARILTGHGLVNRGGARMNMNKMKNNTMNMNMNRSRNIKEYGSAPQSALTSVNGYRFDRRRHDFSDKQFLGTVIKGEGQGELEKALDILARHPATARHISFKLAQYFVSDKPPQALIDRMAAKFRSTDGDIKEVLRVLLNSKEFWDSSAVATKYKSPYRYVVSSLRATDSVVKQSRPIIGFLQIQGMPLYKCLTPDGYKYTEEAWLNPGGLLQRIEFATALGSGRHQAARPRQAGTELLEDIAGIGAASKTGQVIMKSHERLKTALVLGSPEFMMY